MLYSFSRIIVVSSSRTHNLSHLRFLATLATSGMVSISGSDPMGFSKPSLPGSGMYMEEEAKRLEKPGAVDDTKETASSGQGLGQHTQTCTGSNQTNPSTGKGK